MYDGKVVEFFFQEDIMVNATEMGAVFGKSPGLFLRLESTKIFINELEKTAFRAKRYAESAQRFAGNALLEGKIRHRSADLVPLLVVEKGGGEGGATWMHRTLALDFAAWLDVKFKVWMIVKIDSLLTGYASTIRSIAITDADLEEEEKRILAKADHPDVRRLAEIKEYRKQLKGKKLNANKDFNRTIFDQ